MLGKSSCRSRAPAWASLLRFSPCLSSSLSLSFGLARFKVDRDTMALLTRSPRYQRPAKGASNRPEYDPESVLPAGGGGGRLPPPWISPTPRSNPRIYATLARILPRLPSRTTSRGVGWKCENGTRKGRGLEKDERRGETFLIYTTVFLTSIMRPNNCGFGQNRGRGRVDGGVIFMVSFRWRVDRCCCYIDEFYGFWW